MATPGNVSFMSQSDALITAVPGWAADQEIRFRDTASLGNKVVLDESDFIRQCDKGSETDVILGYLEDVTDGREFMNTTHKVSRQSSR